MVPAYRLYGGRAQQRDNGLCSLQCQIFESLPVYPWCLFKLPPWCWSSEGVSLSRWVYVWVSQEELLKALAASSTNSICTGFCSQKLWGLIFLALEPTVGGPGVGLVILTPKISLLNSYPHGCGTSWFRIYAPPTSLDGCGFFNSIAVRLPFTLISDILSDGCSILQL